MTAQPSRNRLFVLHAGALGDCVLTLHWIEAMRRSWGETRVTLAGRSPIAMWAARHGLVDAATPLDAIGAHHLFDSTNEPPDELVRFVRGFDRVVSFLGGPDTVSSGVLRRIVRGTFTAIEPQAGDTTAEEDVHIVDQWADRWCERTRENRRTTTADTRLKIKLSEALRAEARSALHARIAQDGTQTAPIVLCHPGSGGLSKCCPIEALEGVVTRLKECGCLVGWMIGPDEVERFGDDFRKRLERTGGVIFEPSVEAAAELLLGVDAYIGNDAGMTHVAALCGARTIALFGPTDPRVWRPLGTDCEVLRFPSRYACAKTWAEETAKHALSRNDAAADRESG